MSSDLDTSTEPLEFGQFADLPDDALIAAVKRLAAHERRSTTMLIRSLIEFDARRLYLGEGCSSLFVYCTRVLYLSENAAYNRIEAARAARRFPAVLNMIEEGALTLTGVRLLRQHLTDENHLTVLESAKHKSKAEIELLVAALSPRRSALSIVRRAPESVATEWQPGIAPLSPEHYRVHLTISAEAHDNLRRAQTMLRHTVPTGDVAVIVERALALLVQDLERRRCGATTRPRRSTATAGKAGRTSRHIPAAVKRQVWQRDEGQCAFVGRNGRCGERGFLEFHHVHPHADGGPATVDNIQLRCRAHNAYEAALLFEAGAADVVRERRSRYG